MSRSQIEIDFEPCILQRYHSLQDVVADAYGTTRQVKGHIAAACDLSPSELSRQVYRNDGLKLGLDEFERLLDNLDTRGMVLDYIVAKYCQTDEQRIARAVETVERLAPMLVEAAKALQGGKGGAR